MAIVDEQQRGRVEDDLRGFIKGDILFDDLSRTMYSTDASLFQMRPLGVVAPRDEEDVRALVRYAADKGIPIVPRGAGTGVAGESLGHGIIIDMSRHFRRVIERRAAGCGPRPAGHGCRGGRRRARSPAIGAVRAHEARARVA